MALSSSRLRAGIAEMAYLRPTLLPRATPLIASSRSVQSLTAQLTPLTQRTLRVFTTRPDPNANGVPQATLTPEVGNERIEERDIVTEASESYLAYAMSVIVGRALPDVRDGLKPVHRRILFGMHELGMRSDKPFKKCARVVGEVLGKYHPHGDSAVYSALVRMAQDFSMRYTLINGHGNFGSLDNDPPAAMRYTECKLQPISGEMLLEHLEEDTVDFIDTFDAAHQEPTIFPAKVPNLLINGSSGIAVGVATRIPPHNMTEIVKALNELIKNPDVSVEDLMQHVPAPDFPTGGEILRTSGLKATYMTGNGGILMRGTVEIEEEKPRPGRGKKTRNRNAIVITELPYMTNKAHFVEHVAALVENQVLEGISDIFDESDRDGMRVVIELKRGAAPYVVLNNLYKHTSLQSRFSCNMVALVNGKPEMLNLKQFLKHFLDFRVAVITRRTGYQLNKATSRLSIVDGLLKALKHVDDVVTLLRQSQSLAEARQSLQERYNLNEQQAQAIASLQLSRLTVNEVQKLQTEQTSLQQLTEKLQSLLDSPSKILKEVQHEANQISRRFGDDRRSRLVEYEGELKVTDIIPNSPMIITFSRRGYVKRMQPDEFSVQRRGGKGVTGAKMRQDDTMNEIVHVLAHDRVLFFSNDGRVFCLMAYEIPQSSRAAVGTPIAAVLPALKNGARITSLFTLGDKMEVEGKFLLFGTKNGLIKRTPLGLFKKIRSVGLTAMRLKDGDELRFVQTASADSSVLVASNKGQVCRYNVERLRPRSRIAGGVKGLVLPKDGEVVGMAVLPHGVESDSQDEPDALTDTEVLEEEPVKTSSPLPLSALCVLMVTERGIGKLVDTKDFPARLHAGKGNIGIRIRKGDSLVSLMLVSPSYGPQELLVASKQGMMTRIRADSIRKLGRYSFGVKVMNMKDGDRVTSVTTVLESDTTS